MFFFTILLYWVKSNFIRKALIQYKNLAFEKISEKNIAAFSRENTGSYISMLTNDAASIEENYLRKSFLILHYVLLFFGTLIMMLRYSIVLTFATIVLGFLPAIASILMGKELSSREKIVSDKNETFVTQLKNLLAGFSVIKSFQAEKETQELFNTTNAKIEESKCKRYWWECLLSAVSQNLCGNLMQFGIFLFGASLAIHGDITAGTVLIFFNLCNFIIMPVNIVPQYLASRRAARGLIEKLSQMTVDNAEHDGKDIDIVLPNHMKKPLLWICIIAVIIVAAIIISVVAKNNARWVKINDIKGYADFSDTQIEKITLRKSVTSPEWAVFRDDDLLSQWEAFFKKLELKRGSRPAEADLSLNGGGLRIVIVSTNGKEYSFGIWQTSTECIMELGGKFYITNSSDSPFDETYDEAIARHGMTTPWD